MLSNCKKLKFLVLPILFSLFFISCGSNGAPKQNDAKETFKVGAILPLTGDASFLGEAEKKGIELALNEIKDLPGIDGIEIFYEDSRNEAKHSISAINKLINIHNVDAVIATHSGVCGPISDYISKEDQNKLPIIIGTIVASTKITSNNEVFFRLYPSGKQEAIPMANFAKNKLDLNKVCIYYQNDDYGIDGFQNFNQEFEGLGGSITWSNAFDKKTRDHKNALSKIDFNNIDGIYIIGNTPAFALVFKQLSELGFKKTIMTGSSIMVPSLRKLASEGINGTYFSSTLFDIPSSDHPNITKQFLEKFKEKYGNSPSFLEAFTYSSIKLIYEALINSKKSNIDLKENMKNLKEISTPIGLIGFSGSQEANLPIAIQRFDENGKMQLIKTSTNP